MRTKLLWTIAALAAAQSAHGANLTAPFDLENSAVLPPMVRNPRFKLILMNPEMKYSDSGTVIGLGDKLNKAVTFADLTSARSTDSSEKQAEKAQIAGLMAHDGSLAMSDIAGYTTGQVNTYASVKVPVFAMGLTENFTLAAAVPVYDVDVQAATGFVRSEKGEAFVNAAARSSGPYKGEDASNRLNNAINTKLEELGYEPIQSQKISGIGDVKVVGKYRFYRSESDALAVKPAVTLPTGTAPNADKALDIPTGDGQVDVGATLIWDRELAGKLGMSSYLGFNAQLPDQLDRRIPQTASDSLSPEKELVSRNLGDQYSFGTGIRYGSSSKGFSVGAGYSFQYMTSTSYEGSRYARARYDWLEQEAPLQALHAASLSLGFATIDWFKEKKFFYPFQANVVFSKPFAGRNVATSSVVATELVLFF